MAYFDNEMKQINDKYSPLPSLKIARYISIRKLESMLSTKTLFFCNPEKFADKFEGEIPESYFKNWDNESKEVYQKLISGVHKRLYHTFLAGHRIITEMT